MGCFGVFFSSLILIGLGSLVVTLLNWLIETGLPFTFSFVPKPVQKFITIMFLGLLGSFVLFIVFLFLKDWFTSRKNKKPHKFESFMVEKNKEPEVIVKKKEDNLKTPDLSIIDLLYTTMLCDEKNSLDETYTNFLKSTSNVSVYKKDKKFIIIQTTSSSCGELRSRIKHRTPTETWALLDFTPSFTLMTVPWYIKVNQKICSFLLKFLDEGVECDWLLGLLFIPLFAACKAFLSVQFQKDYNYTKKWLWHRNFLKLMGFQPISIWYVGKASHSEWLPVGGSTTQSKLQRGEEVFLEALYVEYSIAQVSGELLPNSSTDKVRTLLCKLITI